MLIRALHAYVCWRIAAGVVGWAWLLLGLATDRCGATNALVAAMHVTAASAHLLAIFLDLPVAITRRVRLQGDVLRYIFQCIVPFLVQRQAYPGG